jgi:hypothetical protein
VFCTVVSIITNDIEDIQIYKFMLLFCKNPEHKATVYHRRTDNKVNNNDNNLVKHNNTNHPHFIYQNIRLTTTEAYGNLDIYV